MSAWNKRVMIERAASVILVADHTKFEQVAFEHVCALAELDFLVTDAAPAPGFAKALEKAGVTVRVAEA